MDNSVFEPLGVKTFLAQLHTEIQELFLENDRPWVIGYSGGKDSTAVVQFLWQALEKLPSEKRNRKKVHVITTDTLVENPVVVTWVERKRSIRRILSWRAGSVRSSGRNDEALRIDVLRQELALGVGVCSR
ncbi:hypothetical protein DesfrDRAFT_3570 [Solidesulfovibrio fructosivorans JJ]]|uniref:Uncharacterized protein n=1 Tax=Solidesulfovibrio fructosivorans JJ] TaxID=596151 RepID=E1K120_SOLFR|nr:hypothetical protein DesfrDRAFT_3570 [Solidesulfovibrio fructosivorans JJ]]